MDTSKIIKGVVNGAVETVKNVCKITASGTTLSITTTKES